MNKLLPILLILLFSCEEEVEYELPYIEQIVIQSVITSNMKLGAPFINYQPFVHISRTLPPLSKVDTNHSYIRDAEVKIISENNIYELEYKYEGFWVNKDFIPNENERYRIEVKYKDKIATAETYIPKASIKKGLISHKPVTEYVRSNYRFFGNYIFWYQDIEFFEDDYIFTIHRIDKDLRRFYSRSEYLDSKKFNKDIEIYFTEFDNYNDTLYFKDTIYYAIGYYDYSIKGYLESKELENNFDSPFGLSGHNRKGNVKGGLGYFVGHNIEIDTIFIEF